MKTFHVNEFTHQILFERLITPSLRFLEVFAQHLSDPQKLADVLGLMFDILSTSRGSANANQNTQLQHLELTTTLPPSCLDQLVSLRQLRTLHLMGITPEYIGGVDYIQRLSTLPYLRNLSLSIDDNQLFRPVEQDTFPSLEHLIIRGEPSSLRSLLCALPPNRLKFMAIVDIVLDWATIISGAEEMRTHLHEWCACFRAVAQQAGTLTKLHIMLNCNTANVDDAKACALGLPMMSILKPLLELRQLQVVYLTGFMKMPYSDVDVRDIAVAWPKIECMALPPPSAEVMQPSLMSLRLLSRFCPRLQNLSIGFDVKTGVDVESNSELLQQLNALPVVTNHALTVLDVYESDLGKEDVVRLADQLRDWFPLLRKVDASRSNEVAAELSAALLQENSNGC